MEIKYTTDGTISNLVTNLAGNVIFTLSKGGKSCIAVAENAAEVQLTLAMADKTLNFALKSEAEFGNLGLASVARVTEEEPAENPVKKPARAKKEQPKKEIVYSVNGEDDTDIREKIPTNQGGSHKTVEVEVICEKNEFFGEHTKNYYKGTLKCPKYAISGIDFRIWVADIKHLPDGYADIHKVVSAWQDGRSARVKIEPVEFNGKAQWKISSFLELSKVVDDDD